MSFYVGGAAGMRNRGTYAAGTQYFANDLVYYNGSGYLATTTTTGNLPTNTSFWSVLAAGAVAVPVGGASGQVLVKNTATDYDTSWSTPVSGGSAYTSWVAGRSYFAPIPMSQGSGTAVYTANSTYFFPLRIPNACTISGVSVFRTATVAASMYIGLFTDVPTAASGGPAIRLGGGTPGASASASAYTVSISYTFTGPTNIWVSYSCNTASIPISINNFLAQSFPVGGLANFSQLWTGLQSSAYTVASPPPADITAITTTAGTATNIPVFAFTCV